MLLSCCCRVAVVLLSCCCVANVFGLNITCGEGCDREIKCVEVVIDVVVGLGLRRKNDTAIKYNIYTTYYGYGSRAS